jgi:hypothetical protein
MARQTAFGVAMLLTVAAVVLPEDRPCGPMGGPDWQPGQGITLLPSLGIAGTLGPYASASLVVGETSPKCAKCALASGERGLLLQATGGLYGARMSMGAAAFNTLVGMAAKATVESTWRDKQSVPAGATYAGPEVEAQVGGFRFTTGVLWRVGGPSGPRARWSWDVAYGFLKQSKSTSRRTKG